MSIRNIKAIFFDYDDTLVLVKDARRDALNNIARILSEKYSLNLDTVINTLLRIEQKMEISGIFNRDLWWREALTQFNITHVPTYELEKLTEIYWNTWAHKTLPQQYALETLYELKRCGYILGLIANTDGKPGLKIKRLFNLIIIAGDDTKEIKPSPEPFIVALNRLNLRGDECMYVGDKAYSDVPGAKAVNMLTVLLTDEPLYGLDPKPDMTIRSLKELLDILDCHKT